MLRPGLIFARGPATIAVMPIADASNDPLVTQMAADVSGRLTDGLAKIENIRVLAPETGAPKADFVVKGELQKSEQAWTIRTRMTETATGEVDVDRVISGQPGGHGRADAAVPARGGRRSRTGAAHQRTAECRHAIARRTRS